jgi:hypothetical protein
MDKLNKKELFIIEKKENKDEPMSNNAITEVDSSIMLLSA